MSRLAAVLLTFAATTGLAQDAARACGGFFCDRPPPDGSLPIAQAGEQVLFVLGDGQVEAHIQIIYKGDAAQFSWVVPVTALPTLDVGTDAMFDRLEAATRPSFQLMWQMDGTCQGFGQSDSVGCGGVSERSDTALGGKAPGPVVEDSRVEVAFRGNVGPYDSAVIRSDDPAALKTWLTTNGYYVSDQAAAVVDDYVAAHSYFVALRLQQGKDTTAIQPIVLRMASNEGCLPLKLTAIAATPDLRVNVWVLGAARAVPLDYVEVGINQAKLDWFNFGKNYDALMGQAADEAGGNAFSVEYAKPSGDVAQQFNIAPLQIVALAHSTDAASFLATLKSMGFEPTGEVLAVLRKHVPLPADVVAAGVTEAQYYSNPYSYSYALPGPIFDAQATTADLQAAVFDPLAKVQPLFASHAYLTRLATFISPEEMTKDPRFVTNAELPDVEPKHAAVAHMLCGDQDYDVCHAPVRLHLESGADVSFAVAAGAPAQCDAQKVPTYDRATVDTLPSADVGWLRDAVGQGHLVVDNTAMIASGLAKHNASVQVSPGGCGCSIRGRARPLAAAFALVALAIARARRRRSSL